MANQRCDFTIGDTIAGKFRVIRCLGEGSFGKVYQVADNTGNKYAMKILKMWDIPQNLQDKILARFDMEYETGRIESPYLVHSYDHGMINGNPYILMEFCPHGDLSHMPPSTDWNRVAHEVLYGLGALHRNGKVHRDLKPENVLIKEDGTSALTDFGIAGDRNHRLTMRDDGGKPIQKFGTIIFMPPEQLNPERGEATVLPTTDIFSFGVMMFLLLTGELPYGPLNNQNDLVVYTTRGKRGEWNKAALQGSPFYQAIDGCLIPNYKQRLQSVEDVLKLLPTCSILQKMPTDHTVPSGYIDGYLLRVMQGEEYGQCYNLSQLFRKMNFVTVGRADRFVRNDIAIKEDQSTYISRQHCTIEQDGGHFRIRDGQKDLHSYGGWKRSTNGTYVNSTEVTENGYWLQQGDIISIGDVKMRFEAIDTRFLT